MDKFSIRINTFKDLENWAYKPCVLQNLHSSLISIGAPAFSVELIARPCDDIQRIVASTMDSARHLPTLIKQVIFRIADICPK